MVAIVATSAAWGCVPGGAGGASAKSLTISPAKVQPGETVTVTAPGAPSAVPIEVRLGGSDGPLLLTLLAVPGGAGPAGLATGTFVLPPATSPGQYALVAVQSGVKWEPALLAVARPDGTVPEAGSAVIRAKSGGGPGPEWMLLGVAALGAGTVLWSVRGMRARAKAMAPAAP